MAVAGVISGPGQAAPSPILPHTPSPFVAVLPLLLLLAVVITVGVYLVRTRRTANQALRELRELRDQMPTADATPKP